MRVVQRQRWGAAPAELRADTHIIRVSNDSWLDRIGAGRARCALRGRWCSPAPGSSSTAWPSARRRGLDDPLTCARSRVSTDRTSWSCAQWEVGPVAAVFDVGDVPTQGADAGRQRAERAGVVAHHHAQP